MEGDPLHDISGERINNGGLYLDTLYAISDTSIVIGKSSTEFSNKILLGSHSDFESRFLIRFPSIPADSFQVDSLRLILTSISNQGETPTPLTGTAYMVTEDWEESVNSDEDWHWQDKIADSPETSIDFELSDRTETTHIIDLPLALLDTWQDTTGGSRNFGLLFDFNSASYIKEFGSTNNSSFNLVPKLIAIYKDVAHDSTIHDTLFADKDASLIDFTGTFDPELTQIAAGYSIKSFFKFDLSVIPKSAAFATMRFMLYRDVPNSVVNREFSEEMNLRTVTSDYDALPYYEVDSTFAYNIYHNVILEEVYPDILDIVSLTRGNVSQSFLQEIINDDIKFGSFMVQYNNERQGISTYVVKDSDASDTNQRPKLIIEYYNIPDPRL